jgi:hypothetical protein
MREAGSVARKSSPKIFFKKTLKFPESRPITYPDDRDCVEKFLRTALKFAKRQPITSQRGREGSKKIEKYFDSTLKFPIWLTLTNTDADSCRRRRARKAAQFAHLHPPVFIGARPRSGRVCQTNSYGSTSSLPDEKYRHSPIVQKFPHSQNLSHRQHTYAAEQIKRRDGNDCERHDG